MVLFFVCFGVSVLLFAFLGEDIRFFGFHLYSYNLRIVDRPQDVYFKGQNAPLVLDLHGLIQAFRGKEESARAEVEAFMEHCAKRWQTKEGTYQLKRRRLLPDVRDPPEQGNRH